MTNIETVEVKNVKYHKGHEGEPLAQCYLYVNGKKAAFYSDGDWGGEAQILWEDNAFISEDEFKQWVKDKNLFISFDDNKFNLPVTADLYISELIETTMWYKKVKKESEKHTVFVLPEDIPKRAFRRLMHHPYDKKSKDYLKEQYSNEDIQVFIKGVFVKI